MIKNVNCGGDVFFNAIKRNSDIQAGAVDMPGGRVLLSDGNDLYKIYPSLEAAEKEWVILD